MPTAGLQEAQVCLILSNCKPALVLFNPELLQLPKVQYLYWFVFWWIHTADSGSWLALCSLLHEIFYKKAKERKKVHDLFIASRHPVYCCCCFFNCISSSGLWWRWSVTMACSRSRRNMHLLFQWGFKMLDAASYEIVKINRNVNTKHKNVEAASVMYASQCWLG